MQDEARPYEEKLKKIVPAYMPVAVVGAIATFAFDVGAHPGSSARDDIVFRGSPLVPPLFLPVALLAAGPLAARRGPVGVAATAAMGLVGLSFIGGTTYNLPNDLDAARDAGSPVWASYLVAAIHLPLGIALASHAFLALRQRRRPAAPPGQRQEIDGDVKDIQGER